MTRARFAEILRRLAEGDVEFVVVGMTAGILRGAPVTTVDIDVVHRRSPRTSHGSYVSSTGWRQSTDTIHAGSGRRHHI